ncbi:sec-independent protein translocase protein TatA [Parapedobacter luteus]|uniref:Sec-independent protein translocase protein TatA n=1 Tax=Parapedobacter luteus TaxID=623280 RepID=A0A1T5FAY9_9SPHI|nr:MULTISPECIES: twin-arginine translocase TatA/TatE family subunit [Parapedobacter]SKB93329.1 sec-independent protein translocase protein TatA [Parapedobacter luteus]
MFYEKTMLLGIMGIGGQELLLITFACLLLFGGKKIPELMRGLGQGVREFKRGQEEAPRQDVADQPTEQHS